ncbi:MAG: lytic transglycosylase domain-containing protein [Desulfotomaculaceae bacterium]
MLLAKRKNITRLFITLVLLSAIIGAKPLLTTVYPFPYRDLTFYYANTYGIDPYLLVALIKTESNFNSRAESHKGARGLMQVMPETAVWASERMGTEDFDPDCLYDPETNVKIGTWYLANLAKEFNDDTILVLAAYNGGSGNVKRWIAGQQLSGGRGAIDKIPFTETREFISKVLWTQKVYRFLYD